MTNRQKLLAYQGWMQAGEISWNDYHNLLLPLFSKDEVLVMPERALNWDTKTIENGSDISE